MIKISSAFLLALVLFSASLSGCSSKDEYKLLYQTKPTIEDLKDD